MLKRILATIFLCFCLTIICYMDAHASFLVDTTDLRYAGNIDVTVLSIQFPTTSGSYYVGLYNFQVSDYFNYAPNSYIGGFCIEDAYASNGYQRYGIYTIDDNTVFEKSAWIASEYFKDHISAEGAQLAIWELILEDPSNSHDLDNGRLRVYGGDSDNWIIYRDEAEAILGLLPSTFNQSGWYLAIHPEGSDPSHPGEGSQNYLVQGPAAPEPTSLMLIGTGILGIFSFGYIKKRKLFRKSI